MMKKEWILIALVFVLGGVYVIFYSGLFSPKTIRIEHSARALRDAYGPQGRRVTPEHPQLASVTFSLSRPFSLTEVAVVSVEEAATNKYPHRLWYLISEEGSEPVQGLSYGNLVPGMAPHTPELEPEPLQPGHEYRLLVEAGSWKGSHDFTAPARSRTRR